MKHPVVTYVALLSNVCHYFYVCLSPHHCISNPAFVSQAFHDTLLGEITATKNVSPPWQQMSLFCITFRGVKCLEACESALIRVVTPKDH